jgi:hypothetical protein
MTGIAGINIVKKGKIFFPTFISRNHFDARISIAYGEISISVL